MNDISNTNFIDKTLYTMRKRSASFTPNKTKLQKLQSILKSESTSSIVNKLDMDSEAENEKLKLLKKRQK